MTLIAWVQFDIYVGCHWGGAKVCQNFLGLLLGCTVPSIPKQSVRNRNNRGRELRSWIHVFGSVMQLRYLMNKLVKRCKKVENIPLHFKITKSAEKRSGWSNSSLVIFFFSSSRRDYFTIFVCETLVLRFDRFLEPCGSFKELRCGLQLPGCPRLFETSGAKGRQSHGWKASSVPMFRKGYILYIHKRACVYIDICFNTSWVFAEKYASNFKGSDFLFGLRQLTQLPKKINQGWIWTWVAGWDRLPLWDSLVKTASTKPYR